MAIYTRVGDKGKTFLLGGKRILKSDLRVEAYGVIDELNSLIGVVLSGKNLLLDIKKELINIQHDLLEIGSNLANPPAEKITYLRKRVKEFEIFIDQITEKLPKLNNFILPGGGEAGAALHLGRAVCRHLERKIVELNKKQSVDANIMVYFNRLSDLLFTMARFANFKERKKEIIWKKRTEESK